MNNKTNWYSRKKKKHGQRNPYARSTEVHVDRTRYDRTKGKQAVKNLIREYT